MDYSQVFDGVFGEWDGNGPAVTVPIEEAFTSQRKSQVRWLALVIKDKYSARAILQEKFGFHALAIEDALNDHRRPSVHLDKDNVFLTIPTVTMTAEGASYNQVGLFLTDRMIVTLTTSHCAFVEEWFARWQLHPGSTGATSDALLHMLSDAAIDDFFPALDAVQESVDDMEGQVYEGHKFAVADSVRIRRWLLEMRKQVSPLRDGINVLLRRDTPFVSTDTRMYLQDTYDHTLRVLESIDLNRDILTSIMDAQLSVQSNRLNEVMRNMTSLSTTLMVMALVTGVYGMNFDHMPELRWKYGYLMVWIVLAVIFFGGIGIATKIGWFKIKWPWSMGQKRVPK